MTERRKDAEPDRSKAKAVNFDFTINIPTIIMLLGIILPFVYNVYTMIKDDHEWIAKVGKPHVEAASLSVTRGEGKSDLTNLVIAKEMLDQMIKEIRSKEKK